MITSGECKKQSENAYKQHAPYWRRHAKIHSKYEKKSLDHFENSGVGKAILLIAHGASFEEEIETIKRYRHYVDVMCCDKSLSACIEHGIVPDFCFVADAKVSYEKYLKPVEDKLSQTTLVMNVCGNPEWTEKGNWKDRYFVTFLDSLGTEKEFSKLSGCNNLVPAATNVSNSMVVFVTQSTNGQRKNFFGYDKILLIGYDYSWEIEGSYYAFNKGGFGKRNYMNQVLLYNRRFNLCHSSGNLIFSARWLDQYIHTFNLPVVLCSKSSVLGCKYVGELKEQMQYSFKREDAKEVRLLKQQKDNALRALEFANTELRKTKLEHYRAFRGSV